MRAWGLPEEFWVQEREQRSPADKWWHSVQRHPVRAPSHFARRGRCWTPKAHLQPIFYAAHQDVHRLDLWKQELWINANLKEKCELYLRNIVHFAAAPARESTVKICEQHRISRIFDSIHITLRRQESSSTQGNANAEDLCEIFKLQKFKLFQKTSQGFWKVFF